MNKLKKLLQEMLYLSDDQVDQVKEDMTVKEIRAIRKEGCATSHTEKTGLEKQGEVEVDEKAFIYEFCFRMIMLSDFKRICQENQSDLQRALALQKYVAPNNFRGIMVDGFSCECLSFAKGVNMKIGDQERNFSYRKLVRLIDERYGPYDFLEKEECATSYTEHACDWKCFNCDNQECNCVQEKRQQCVLNPDYTCTTANIYNVLKQDDPDIYKNCVGCCNSCPQESICGYRCNRPKLIGEYSEEVVEYPEMDALDKELHVEEEVEIEEYSSADIDTTYTSLDLSLLLAKEEETLRNYFEVGGFPEKLVKKQTMIVDALRILYEKMKE